MEEVLRKKVRRAKVISIIITLITLPLLGHALFTENCPNYIWVSVMGLTIATLSSWKTYAKREADLEDYILWDENIYHDAHS